MNNTVFCPEDKLNLDFLLREMLRISKSTYVPPGKAVM